MLVTIGGLYQNIDGYQELLYIQKKLVFHIFIVEYKPIKKYMQKFKENLKKIEKILDTTGIFVIIIPMFFNVKEVDIYEDDIPT